MVIGIVAFFVLTPKEDVRVKWDISQKLVTGGKDENLVRVLVYNYGDTELNISRVELIYLPDETLGLIWLEERTIRSPRGTDREYWVGVNGSSNVNLLNGEQVDFFNLLWEQPMSPIVKIIVETEEAIYTYYPERFLEDSPRRPDSIEEK